MENNVRLSRALPVLLPLLLSGCLSNQRHGLPHAIGEQLAANAINYNLAMEKSQNEMMLLNVVRAMQHRPLYLTDTSKVTGTVNGSFSLGLSLPFGTGWQGNDNVHGPTASPTISYSTSPSMDVNLLDSQDFMVGFVKPISPKLFAYYWDQGWEAELLLYTFVLKVDEYDQDAGLDGKFRLTNTYRNHPMAGNTGLLEGFASWVRAMMSAGRPTTKAASNPFQRTIPVEMLDTNKKGVLRYLEAVSKDQGMSLTPFDSYLDKNPLESKDDPGKDTGPPTKPSSKVDKPSQSEWPWTLASSDETRALVYSSPTSTAPTKSKYSMPSESHPEAVDRKDIGETAAFGSRLLAIPSNLPKSAKAQGHAPIYVLTLRSPEAVLFYLGELASMANPQVAHPSSHYPPQALLIHTWDTLEPLSLQPLFMVRPASDGHPCPGPVSTRTLEGDTFIIPAGLEFPATSIHELDRDPVLVSAADLCTGGESMHALSLLSQLIALQKSAKDFPTTSTVKVVGQ